MNMQPIPKIIARIRATYPSYKFDMKAKPSTNTYIIDAIRDGVTLSSLSVAPNTPINEFWVSVREWMITVFLIPS